MPSLGAAVSDQAAEKPPIHVILYHPDPAGAGEGSAFCVSMRNADASPAPADQHDPPRRPFSAPCYETQKPAH